MTTCSIRPISRSTALRIQPQVAGLDAEAGEVGDQLGHGQGLLVVVEDAGRPTMGSIRPKPSSDGHLGGRRGRSPRTAPRAVRLAPGRSPRPRGRGRRRGLRVGRRRRPGVGPRALSGRDRRRLDGSAARRHRRASSASSGCDGEPGAGLDRGSSRSRRWRRVVDRRRARALAGCGGRVEPSRRRLARRRRPVASVPAAGRGRTRRRSTRAGWRRPSPRSRRRRASTRRRLELGGAARDSSTRPCVDRTAVERRRRPRSSPAGMSPSRARRSRMTLRGRKCSRCWRRTQRSRSTSCS